MSFTVSKTFWKSKNTPHTQLFLLGDELIFSVVVINRCFVEWDCLKPNLSLLRYLFWTKLEHSQLSMIFSVISQYLTIWMKVIASKSTIHPRKLIYKRLPSAKRLPIWISQYFSVFFTKCFLKVRSNLFILQVLLCRKFIWKTFFLQRTWMLETESLEYYLYFA